LNSYVQFIEIVLCIVALVLLAPATVLFAEVFCAVAGHREVHVHGAARRRVALLMPAHNEASVIAGALRSIIPQLNEVDRLVVVADNCSDETASIAAAEGAEVINRTDLIRFGKGYALDFGVQHLERDAPDVVIVVDADCEVTAGSIDCLARLCSRTGRPAQSLYLMHSPAGSGLKGRVAEFAWVVKNRIRPTGLSRLGLPCQLMGTGMAFPWSCISASKLATGHIVEDLKLGIDLARAGTPPIFCPQALITSQFPSSGEGIWSQRTRWEHGSLSIIQREAPRLLWDALYSLNPGLMALALDLLVPPLALLMLLVVAGWFISAVFYLYAKVRFPLDMMSAACLLFALAVLLSWGRYGRRIISLKSLALAVLYSLWKIPIYAKFLVSRQLDWVRSKRDAE
jgi:cellulose synthase/poly-beta-1,6-N-acetylglucosamine synthase-like glycosyltransferase